VTPVYNRLGQFTKTVEIFQDNSTICYKSRDEVKMVVDTCYRKIRI